jgi:cell division protease FtsH
MMLESWLPIGYKLSDGARSKSALFEGPNWQILETQGGGRALIVRDALPDRWIGAGLIEEGLLTRLDFGDQTFRLLSSGPSQALCPISEAESPESKAEALAFAIAFSATRAIDEQTPLQDAIYAEKISRLLPTYSISSRTDDALVLGYWLSGGANVSAQSFRRLRQMTGWLGSADLKEIVATAGVEVAGESATESSLAADEQTGGRGRKRKSGGASGARKFELPGRPELEAFFNEHVVDIVENSERYEALGIGFPGAVVLHGPPGCGKTFAVEKLVEFLGWPSFQIDASSIGSKYIHETSMKVAAIFDKAMDGAPSVLVIDEMEGFLAERSMDSGQYRIEEVGEFLRRIPEASKNEVLIVAMTNRIDMIDQAILRRGRFDHIIKVGHASETEISSLLNKLLSAIPKEGDVDAAPLAKRLAGRPLSDVAFVVREAARLSARSGSDKLSQQSLLKALSSTAARHEEDHRSIGFV